MFNTKLTLGNENFRTKKQFMISNNTFPQA